MDKKKVPYKSDWKEYNYACLFGPFENYQDCKNFEKQCTGYSSQDKILYEQYTSNKLSQKRSRKRNPKYDKTDSNEQFSECEDENPAKKKIKHPNKSKLPPLPSTSDFVSIDSLPEVTSRITIPISKELSIFDNIIDNKNNSEYINIATKKTYDKNDTTYKDNDFEKQIELHSGPMHTNVPIFISLNNEDAKNAAFYEDDENNINIPNVPEGTSQTERVIRIPKAKENVVNSKSNIGCMNCCPCLGKINRKLDMVVHILQSKNMNEINNNTRQENVEFLQVETNEEFEALEKLLLEDAEKREQFKNVLKQEGGKNVGEHLRRIMKKIMTDNLAVQYSWSGQKNTIRFKDFHISKLILNTVASLHTSVNRKTMEDVIQSWLNHASDRKTQAEKREYQHT